MTLDQWLIITLFALVLGLFIWGKWRYDVVALMALFSCVLLNLIPTDQVFAGFGHPATITVAIVLILSYGLTKSGAVEGIAKLVAPLSKIPSLHIAALVFIAAFLSMFMNNVGALALLMPVAIQSTQKAGRSPSTVLMPLSFGSILGGLVTLIGTPPNIIIATYRENITGEAYKMFDFAPVGGAVAAAGILFMVVLGWRLVKIRKGSASDDLFQIDTYLFEVKVPKESSLKGKTIKELEEILKDYDVSLAALIEKKQYHPVPSKKHKIAANAMLIFEGVQTDVDKLVSKFSLALLSADSAKEAIRHSSDMVMMEVVIGPSSQLVGRKVETVRFKGYHNVNLLAVSREGTSHHSRLRDMILRAGDVLLLHGEAEQVEKAITKLDAFPLAQRDVNFGKRKYALPAIAIFVTAVALPAFGVLPIQVSLGIAVIFMVLFQIIPVRELYDGVDWPVIVLLGAMIPVGGVLESTGATSVLAQGLLHLAGDASLVMVLALVMVITMTLSDILNNAATVILMAPIGKTIAQTAGVSVDPFLMAVAIGASCAFLTPIGHQNNALVMGPGGYRFSDYWRVGILLEVIILLVGVPMILTIWPF